jgi:hypothetical protein
MLQWVINRVPSPLLYMYYKGVEALQQCVLPEDWVAL